jgi:hypothetical protein
MKETVKRCLMAATTIAALATGATAVPASAEVHIQAGYRTVIASSLTLWNAPSGGSSVGSWGPGQCFYWTVIEGSNRYRTFTGSGATVWVSADPAWSVAGC